MSQEDIAVLQDEMKALSVLVLAMKPDELDDRFASIENDISSLKVEDPNIPKQIKDLQDLMQLNMDQFEQKIKNEFIDIRDELGFDGVDENGRPRIKSKIETTIEELQRALADLKHSATTSIQTLQASMGSYNIQFLHDDLQKLTKRARDLEESVAEQLLNESVGDVNKIRISLDALVNQRNEDVEKINLQFGKLWSHKQHQVCSKADELETRVKQLEEQIPAVAALHQHDVGILNKMVGDFAQRKFERPYEDVRTSTRLDKLDDAIRMVRLDVEQIPRRLDMLDASLRNDVTSKCRTTKEDSESVMDARIAMWKSQVQSMRDELQKLQLVVYHSKPLVVDTKQQHTYTRGLERERRRNAPDAVIYEHHELHPNYDYPCPHSPNTGVSTGCHRCISSFHYHTSTSFVSEPHPHHSCAVLMQHSIPSSLGGGDGDPLGVDGDPLQASEQGSDGAVAIIGNGAVWAVPPFGRLCISDVFELNRVRCKLRLYPEGVINNMETKEGMGFEGMALFLCVLSPMLHRARFCFSVDGNYLEPLTLDATEETQEVGTEGIPRLDGEILRIGVEFLDT